MITSSQEVDLHCRFGERGGSEGTREWSRKDRRRRNGAAINTDENARTDENKPSSAPLKNITSRQARDLSPDLFPRFVPRARNGQ